MRRDPSEIANAVDDIAARLGIHHHDVCPENTVRGLIDGKLKIIDFAKAMDKEE